MLERAGSTFRPLEARRLMMALRLLAVSEPSGGGEAAGALLSRQDECVRIVFRAGNLVRLVESVLLGAIVLNREEREIATCFVCPIYIYTLFFRFFPFLSPSCQPQRMFLCGATSSLALNGVYR